MNPMAVIAATIFSIIQCTSIANAQKHLAIPLVGDDGKPGEEVLEVLLSPGEFHGRTIVHTSKGDEAIFCLDSSLSAKKPFAELYPQRVNWPPVAGLSLKVVGNSLRLSSSKEGVDDETLDKGFAIRWTFLPLGQSFEKEPVFKVQVIGAEVISTVTGRTLMRWRRPAPPDICTSPPHLKDPSCDLLGVGREVRSLALNPAGNKIALAHGGLRPRMEIMSLGSTIKKEWEALFPTDSGGAMEVAFSADGQWVVALTGDGIMHRFDAKTGGRHMSIPSQGRTAQSIPPGHIMAVAGDGGEVTLWYLSDGTIAWRLPPRKLRGPVDRLATSGDGNRFATLEYTETKTVVRVWEVNRRAMLAQIEVDQYAISDIALDATGTHLFLTHKKQGLLTARVQRSNPKLSNFGGTAGLKCTGSLQWIDNEHRLSCATSKGVLKINEKGKLDSELKTRVDSSGWIVASALGGEKIAAVGAGHLLIWNLEAHKK